MSAPPAAALEEPRTAFALALEQIAARAAELDANPRFPRENFDVLLAAGVPQLAGGHERRDFLREIATVRAVASVDASTARILDGHFNGVERLVLAAAEEPRIGELPGDELDRVVNGELLMGVWGADPAPGEGTPAQLLRTPDGEVLRGVKTFCSGAGGVQRALVVARDERGARRVAYAQVSDSVAIDRSWYRASGLRSSESHRVEFRNAPVLAILGGEDELTREPWFGRDAVRTAATWAGLADCIVQAALAALGERCEDELRLHAVGCMRVAQSTIDRWLEHTGARLGDAGEYALETEPTTADGQGARALAGECRVALADAARTIAAQAARACGSRALVGGGTLDRARRDLDLFLLQHRLDPKLVELGARALAGNPQ